MGAVEVERTAVDRETGRCAGHGEVDSVSDHEGEAPKEYLKSGRVGVVAHESVSEGQRFAVGCARSRHPGPGEIGSAEILDQGQRTGIHDLKCGGHSCHRARKFTVSPGAQNPGGI